MVTPEFSRPVRTDDIGPGRRDGRFEAVAGERAALAARFGLLALDRLAATLAWRREAGGVRVTGEVSAAGAQACVATGEPVAFELVAPLDLRFADAGPAGEEVELASEELDMLPLEGEAVDLGEAAAQTLALALDPFPRAGEAAGVLSEDAAVAARSPFAVLKR